MQMTPDIPCLGEPLLEFNHQPRNLPGYGGVAPMPRTEAVRDFLTPSGS